MAINVVYGQTPGNGGLVGNQLATSTQIAQADRDRNFQAQQREFDRQLQEELATKQMRQQALFGGINAAVNVAQLGMGIPNFLESVRNLGGPTQRQIAATAQDRELGIRETLAAAQITGQALADQRRDARVSESAAVGNTRMLANVSAEADRVLGDRIAQGDSDALSEGLRSGKFAYSPSLASSRRSWQSQIERISNDPSYTPAARQSAISTLQQSLAATQFNVQPAPGAPPDAGEVFHRNVYTDAGGTKWQINKRDGTWRQVASIEEEEKAKTDHKIRYDRELAEIKASDFGAQYDSAFTAVFKANQLRYGDGADDPTPTHDQVLAYMKNKRAAIDAMRNYPTLPAGMTASMTRQSTLSPKPPAGPAAIATDSTQTSLGLSPVGDIFQRGAVPANPAQTQPAINDPRMASPQPATQQAPEPPRAPAKTTKEVTERVTQLLPSPKSPQELAALPRGTLFLAPNGKIFRKK